MRLLYRSLVVALSAAAVATALLGGYAFTLRARIACYDRSFYNLPATSEDLVAQIGSPHVVSVPPRRPWGRVDKFYVYTSGQFVGPPVIWTYGIDATGKVVSRHRDANGC